MHSTSTRKFKSILVVDDNGINRLLPGLILRPFGWDVHEADGGLAAIEILKTTHPFKTSFLNFLNKVV